MGNPMSCQNLKALRLRIITKNIQNEQTHKMERKPGEKRKYEQDKFPKKKEKEKTAQSALEVTEICRN